MEDEFNILRKQVRELRLKLADEVLCHAETRERLASAIEDNKILYVKSVIADIPLSEVEWVLKEQLAEHERADEEHERIAHHAAERELENKKLRHDIAVMTHGIEVELDLLRTQVRELRGERNELADALKGLAGWFDDSSYTPADRWLKKARKVLAKIDNNKGEQHD